ncbi:MAG: hypothetical protein JET69_04880 [Methanomassiliicoccales archaeon]|nr:hypothetical protein [Methanomassiliicoccales archaeon]
MDENSPAGRPSTPAPLTWAPPAPEKKSNKIVIAIVIAVVAVLIIAVFAFTMMNMAANVKSKANQMTIKLSDLPAGWHSSTTTIDTSDYKGVDSEYTVFNNTQGLDFYAPWCEIISQVFVFDTVLQAKADFKQLQDDPTYTMEEVPGHFDQCLLMETSVSGADIRLYAFQEKNVGGVISFTTVFGYDITDAWINEMLDLQENKIV